MDTKILPKPCQISIAMPADESYAWRVQITLRDGSIDRFESLHEAAIYDYIAFRCEQLSDATSIYKPLELD